MADISDVQAAQSVKLIGSGPTGVESTPINSTSHGNILSYDVADGGGLDTTITITAGSVVELKVGAAVLPNRRYIQIQSRGRDVTWGYSALTQSFDAFKNQFFILPFGPNTSVYLKNNGSSSVDVAIGETV